MNQPDEKRPQDPFEAASYDLNKFRERRVADRRFQQRDTPDRRKTNAAAPQEPIPTPWDVPLKH
ncbi:MAG TPA: hypothetical protein VEC06_07010 [Paucimonas sp.]|nr:hypothetical protein [Paucimonas sp.]